MNKKKNVHKTLYRGLGGHPVLGSAYCQLLVFL